MVWSRKLPRLIYLNDGRTVGTLAAARDLMLSLPQILQASEHWQSAAKLLLRPPTEGVRNRFAMRETKLRTRWPRTDLSDLGCAKTIFYGNSAAYLGGGGKRGGPLTPILKLE
jgi:hypothetical protein